MIPSEVKEVVKGALKDWIKGRTPQAIGRIPESMLKDYNDDFFRFESAIKWLEQQEVEPCNSEQ